MTFDWNRYLDLAKDLGGIGSDAARRSAVSRAYYFAFHVADHYLKTNNVILNPKYNRDRHLRVWNIYMDSVKKDCARLGNLGQRLKIARHDADYDPDIAFSDTFVQKCISDAERLATGIAFHIPESFSAAPVSSSSFLMRLKRLLRF